MNKRVIFLFLIAVFVIIIASAFFLIKNLDKKEKAFDRNLDSIESEKNVIVNEEEGNDADKDRNDELSNENEHDESNYELRNEKITREALEIPSESEREKLPDCSDIVYTQEYIDPLKIREIGPLGNVDPPAHTIPTNHVFTHLDLPRVSTQTLPLYLPADAWITHISIGKGFTQDPEDDTIYFAVCKDVIGYFNHVKKLSPELQKIVDDYQCPEGTSLGQGCYMEVLTPVKKGTYIGEVGRLQGNFDFGTIDLRKEHPFVNKERYAKRTFHIQCPFDYYTPELKEKYYSLLQNKGNCGKINYDIATTLQGNWFYGNSKEYYGGDWVKHAFFGYDSVKTEKAVISIGGVIVPEEGLRWKFIPLSTGLINRKFDDVKNGGNIYCYDANNQDEFNKSPQGRILVKMEDDLKVKLEHQSGSCSESMSFTEKAKVYER